MQCTKCGSEAVLYQQYSGLHLCRHHFFDDFEAKAKRAIRRNSWICPKDHVAVVLTGSPSGSALLHFLYTLLHRRKDIRLSAIGVDRKIAGSVRNALSAAVTRYPGVEYREVSFSDRYGTTMDAVAGKSGTAAVCSTCRSLHMHLLQETARSMGATRLACAASLDQRAFDVAGSFLAGRPEQVLRPGAAEGKFIPVMYPFETIPLSEIALYASLLDIPLFRQSCRWIDTAGTGTALSPLLEEYNSRHPATFHALANLGQRITECRHRSAGEFCPWCGAFLAGCEPCRCRENPVVSP